MSTDNFSVGPSPYDPYSRAKLGWIDPIEVTDSLSDQAIAGYMSSGSGQAYELMHNPQEYFLVSNHKLDAPFASQWEDGFPGKGLLIWHIDTTGNIYHLDHKLVDVETADGLYDTATGNPNDSTGVDSIDVYNKIGYYWCFFNNTTKQAFNNTSNPTTDGYVCYDTTNGKWKQTISTGIAANDIQGVGGGTMWADLFSPNVWWGPGTVYVTGDVVIGRGCTLHVLPGTVVKFETTCKLIVKGTLDARGTQQDSICFHSASSTPSDSDWSGIRVRAGGSARFNYCDLRNAYTAIFDSGNSHDSVTHCRFKNNFMHAVSTKNSHLSIDSCVIENDSTGGSGEIYGILCDKSTPTIKNTLIKNCEHGIKVAGQPIGFSQTSALIEECGFYNMRATGILAASSSAPTIKKCCFKGNFGKTCIEVNSGSPYIEKCYMASQENGIVIGMLFTGGAKGKVRQTTLWDYDSCAVEIASTTANPNFGTSDSAGSNWFERAACCNYFISTSSYTIKAELNEWGTNDSAYILDKIYGNVDFSPFLDYCTPPIPYYPDICSNLPPYDPTISPCKIAVTNEEKMPKSFSGSQNYPNPFNPLTVIKCDLPEPEHVKITIYNILGQKVRTVVDEDQQSGYKSVNWDGKDDQGKDVSTGIYFYQIKAGDFSMVKKMVLLK